MWTDKNLNLDSYLEFIHSPRLFFNPPKDVILFENPILEMLTKTPWYLIPLTWSPWIFHFLDQS